jgi:hypothetical protein
MPLYGPSTATATVAANTNVVTIAGMDLNAVVQQGMTINLGARDRAVGDAWIINTVVPNGTNGGTLTTAGSIPTAYNSVPFLIDTRGFNGTDSSFAAAVSLKLLATLTNLLGTATNLFAGSRQLVLDKVASTAIGRIAFAIAGRTWGDLAQRSITYTPTGGQVASIETMAVRAFPDGTTPIDALLLDLSNGTGDLRKGAATMVANSTVDLGSAPMGKVAILGSATINSFGAGRHLERLVRFVDGGATLVHNAASLDLPGGANIVIRAGDRLHVASDGSGNWRVHAFQRADGSALVGAPMHAKGQCRLICTSTSQVRLVPYDGNLLMVGGAYAAIPAAGVNLSNSGLVAGSVYYVYAFLASGVLTLEASTATPVADATYGAAIKTSDASRTLVGMVYMDAGSPGTFADTGLKRFTASYFNRRTRTVEGPPFVASTTSTNDVELNPAARVNFITWGDEATSLRIAGFSENFSAGQTNNLRLSFNGSAVGSQSSVTSASAFARGAVSASADLPDARGYNVATILASVSGGTGNFALSIMGTTRI